MRVIPYVVVLALVFGVPAASAQEMSWGIKGGVNFANLETEADSELAPLDMRIGIVAGVFFTVPIGGLFSIQPEILYSQKGNAFDIPELAVEGATEIDYLETPILVRVGRWRTGGTTFNAFAGPSLGFKVRARATAEGAGERESIDISDDIETFDFGVVFGGGVEFGRFVVDGRYTWGLSNLSKADDDLKVTNRVISIMGGVRF
jgi:hypothetical protein